MSKKFVIFVFLGLFLILVIFSNARVAYAVPKKDSMIRFVKKRDYKLKKYLSRFSCIENLFVEDNILYFSGNTKSVHTTYRLGDINNPANNYICRYDLSAGKLIMRRFPDAHINRIFKLLYGKYIYLFGDTDIYIYDKDALSLVKKIALKTCLELPFFWVVRNNSEDLLVYFENDSTQENVMGRLVILDICSSKEVSSCTNTCSPEIDGDFIIWGMKKPNRFLIQFFSISKKMIVREISLCEKSLPKGLEDFNEYQIFLYNNELLLCTSDFFCIINKENGKVLWLKNKDNTFSNVLRYQLIEGLLFTEHSNEVGIFNINQRRFIDKITIPEDAYLKLFHSSKNQCIIAFTWCGDSKYNKIIAIDKNGKVKDSVTMNYDDVVSNDGQEFYFIDKQMNLSRGLIKIGKGRR